MAESTDKKSQDSQEHARQAAQRGADALREQGSAVADAGRASAAAGSDAMRHFGKAASAGLSRRAEMISNEQTRFIEATSAQVGHVAQAFATAMQERADDLRELAALPQFSGAGLTDMQQGVQRLVEGVVQTNLRSAQAMFELADPPGYVKLQQQFMREYMHALMEGSAIFFRAARQTAEQTLRPLEQQLEERRRQKQQARQDERVAAE